MFARFNAAFVHILVEGFNILMAYDLIIQQKYFFFTMILNVFYHNSSFHFYLMCYKKAFSMYLIL